MNPDKISNDTNSLLNSYHVLVLMVTTFSKKDQDFVLSYLLITKVDNPMHKALTNVHTYELQEERQFL